MNSAAYEILAIFRTNKTIERYLHEGIIEFLNKAATKRNVSVRVLVAKDHVSDQDMDIRYLKEPITMQVITILVDHQFSLIIELKDDVKDNSSEIGLDIYSNSEATVLTYNSIFELLCIKSELRKSY